MGLFSRKIKKPVHGTAQVVSCSQHDGDGRWQNCRMQLVVHVDGKPPYSAEVRQLAPRKKWPQPGMMVPVHIAPDDPQRVKVDFDSMETGRDQARRLAEDQVAGHGQAVAPGMPTFGTPMTGAPGGGAAQVHIVGDPGNLSPERLAQFEQMLGMDLNGDGSVGGVPPGTTSPSGGDDRLAQLERLASLRDSGALSEREFQREKQRLLDG